MCIDVSIIRFIGRVLRTHCPASRIKRLARMHVYVLFSLFINRIYIYNMRAYNREEMCVYVAPHTGVSLFYFYFYRRYGLFFFSFIFPSSLFHLLRKPRNEKRKKKAHDRPSYDTGPISVSRSRHPLSTVRPGTTGTPSNAAYRHRSEGVFSVAENNGIPR